MVRNPALAALVLLCAAFAVGCGGPSKEEYAKEANGVCSQLRNDLPESQAGDDPAEVNRRIDQAMTKAVDRMKGLDRPDGEAGEQAEQFTAAYERFLNQDYRPGLKEIETAIARRDRDPRRDREAFLSAALALRDKVQGANAQNAQKSNLFAGQLGASECVVPKG